MFCNQIKLAKVFGQESDEANKIFFKRPFTVLNSEELTGWEDEETQYKHNKTDDRISTKKCRSLRPKAETPKIFSRRHLNKHRDSVQFKPDFSFEKKLTLKDIEKIYTAGRVSLTPKQKILMICSNREKIMKMNEGLKKKTGTCFEESFKIQSLSPVSAKKVWDKSGESKKVFRFKSLRKRVKGLYIFKNLKYVKLLVSRNFL